MTDAELVLLSLVAEGPRLDYDIQQLIETRRVRDWAAIGFSSVFYLLNKLEEEGLLTSRLEPVGRGPARRSYTLTDAGRGVLQTAIADRLSTPHDHGDGFLLGLANLHLLRPEQVRHALDTYESRLRTRIADLNRLRAEQAADPVERPLYVLALFDYGLHMALAELEWLTEFRQAWEAQTPPAPPKPPRFRTPIFRGTPTPPSSPTEELPRSSEGNGNNGAAEPDSGPTEPQTGR
ncbi:MAG: helix-turn-helix transcriptional regulator [Anaerolineae bacterium]|nr:helix-turn-helix transcriptional regulator [Anaerolineae bacterium]